MVFASYPKSQNTSDWSKHKWHQVKNIVGIVEDLVDPFLRISRHVPTNLLDTDSDQDDDNDDFVDSWSIAELLNDDVSVVDQEWNVKQKAEKGMKLISRKKIEKSPVKPGGIGSGKENKDFFKVTQFHIHAIFIRIDEICLRAVENSSVVVNQWIGARIIEMLV